MKKVDFNKLQAGDLVEVPRTQFAPMRRGWNGWLFSEADQSQRSNEHNAYEHCNDCERNAC